MILDLAHTVTFGDGWQKIAEFEPRGAFAFVKARFGPQDDTTDTAPVELQFRRIASNVALLTLVSSIENDANENGELGRQSRTIEVFLRSTAPRGVAACSRIEVFLRP